MDHAHPFVRRGPLAAALLALVLAACSEAPAPVASTPEPILQGSQLRYPQGHPELALLNTTAGAASTTIDVNLPAKLVWSEEHTQRIYPAFAGRVMSIKADVGQAVRPGSALAVLASPEFGAAQADTAKAQADLVLARKTQQRVQELHDAGIVARKDLEQAQADFARAESESLRAQARTRLYGAGAGVDQQLVLSASLGGIVVERNLNPGQEVRPDQSGPGVPALFVISDPTRLWVQIDARETEAGTLKPGAEFDLLIPALGGEVFHGHVAASADAIDPVTRTIKVRGVVANPERRLKAEMLATARIQRSMGAGVKVPASAVILRGTKHWVFLAPQPGVFEPREVRLSYEGTNDIVISSGLEVGDAVVSQNVLLLARQYNAMQKESKEVATSAVPAKPSAAMPTQPSGAVAKP